MTEKVPETFAEQQLANARSDPRLGRDEWQLGRAEALEDALVSRHRQ